MPVCVLRGISFRALFLMLSAHFFPWVPLCSQLFAPSEPCNNLAGLNVSHIDGIPVHHGKNEFD